MKKELFLLAAAFILLVGCVQTGVPQNATASATPTPTALKAKQGDTVRIDYTMKLTDGTVIDSTICEVALRAGRREREVYAPLQFTIGEGKVTPSGLEDAVIGMAQGEFKIVTIPPEEGFGLRNASLVITFNKSDLVYGGEAVRPGQWLLEQTSGHDCMVLNVSNTTFTADCNHPLAGESLVFEITLVELKPKTV